MKIKFVKPGYYNCNYPMDSVVEVDENFGKYAIGVGDAITAKTEDKITDPIPYVMTPKTTGAEDALTVIANALKGIATNAPAPAPVKHSASGALKP